jgi:DNA-binding CsgD family transcriptional regulator
LVPVDTTLFRGSETRALSDHLLAIHGAGDTRELLQQTLAAVRRLIDGDYWSVGLCDPRTERVVGLSVPGDLPIDRVVPAYPAIAHQSPLLRYWVRTSRHDDVLRRADCVDEGAFRNGQLWAEFFRKLQLTFQIGTWIRGGGGHHLEIGVYRDNASEFSPRDVRRLALLRAHVRQAYLRALELERVRNLPPAAQRLLRADAHRQIGEIKVLPMQYTALTADLDRGPADAVAAAPRVADLTAREVEVLGWVAEGKTNPEIGIILGTSWRTVQKHVENILRKLGVETRTAAAVRAAELGIRPAEVT